MNFIQNSYISIFDQIESINPNPKEFCFEKYKDSFIEMIYRLSKKGIVIIKMHMLLKLREGKQFSLMITY